MNLLVDFGISAMLVAAAYTVCIVLVLAVVFIASKILGQKMAPGGSMYFVWNVIYILVWIGGAFLAGCITQSPIGFGAFFGTLGLATVFFAVHMRAITNGRSQSKPVQIALCVLCPLAAFAAMELI